MAAAIEYRRCYLWGLVLLGFILPLQLILVLYARANLPLVLLVDLSAWLLLSILLRPSKDFLFSPFIATSLRHRLLNGAQLPPSGWLHYNSVWSRMKWQSVYFIVQFDADYSSRPASQRLLTEMQKISGAGTIACCLIPGWYAVLCPAKSVNITRIETCLRLGLAGHVRNVVRINPDLTLQQNIANVLQASKRVRQSTSEQRSIATLFELLLKNETLKQAQEICSKIPNDRVTFTTQLGTTLTSIQQQFGEIPLIAWNGTRLIRVGQVGQSLLLTAGKLFTEAQRMRTLLPRPPSPFIAVASGGTILTLLDPSVLKNQADREKLRLWSCALTLTFSIQLMKVGQPLIELPEDLFYFITETVQKCIEQSGEAEQNKQPAYISKNLTPSFGNIPLLRGVSTRRLEDRKRRLVTGRSVALCYKVVKDNGDQGHQVRGVNVH